jgi:histidine triad (HIT) family protein
MSEENCIFCKIIRGEIPSTKIYEDELIIAFNDINPVAPVHVLVVPKKHIADNNAFAKEDEPYAGRMFSLLPGLAQELGIAQTGYRLIMNTGSHGHQEVEHMHLHLIGGQAMKHPMG